MKTTSTSVSENCRLMSSRNDHPDPNRMRPIIITSTSIYENQTGQNIVVPQIPSPYPVHLGTTVLPGCMNDVIQYEVFAQILLATVRCARHHRDFGILDRGEQNRILQRGWALLFALKASAWPLDISILQPNATFAGATAAGSLMKARAALLDVRPDHVEFSALETFALCRPELTETSNGRVLMGKARDSAAEALIRHLDARGHSGQRLAKLMLILPTLGACCSCNLANSLFAPIIGDVALDQVIASIQ